jgi:hypothetical protein
MDFVFGGSWLRVTVISLTLAGLSFIWANERKSVEHANRLHRSGDFPKAAAVYQSRIDSDSLRPGLRYNIGTSLLELGSAGAEEELALGVESNDDEVTKLALYNLGVSRLLRAVSAEHVDSMRIHARASVQANRNTLRLSPDQADAKWNLSMAQRLLDSIDAANRRAGRATAEGPADPDELVPAENMLEGEEEDPRQGFAPLEGDEESLADLSEEAPLPFAEAAEILGATRLDGAAIMRKLLALESRTRWGRQLGRVGPKR